MRAGLLPPVSSEGESAQVVTGTEGQQAGTGKASGTQLFAPWGMARMEEPMLVPIPQWLPHPPHQRGRQHAGGPDQRAPKWTA